MNFIDYLKEYFNKEKPIIKIGSIGIYQDVLSINTTNNGTYPVNYDMFVKVKAVGLFDGLVEIEIIDIDTINHCNDDIKTMIRTNMSKYIQPKFIKWEKN